MATGPDDQSPNADAAAATDDTTPATGAAAVEPLRLPIGTVVAHRYRVVRYLARGGMGEVYEAQDLELDERVALKTVRTDIRDPANEERLKREINLSRKVTHPNVCRIFDVGYDQAADGSRLVFFTMELILGETLLARIRREGPLPIEVADLITRQIVSALGAAHAAGVVHRDLKSGNVLLGVRNDGSLRAAVADFGLAHGLNSASDLERSLTGSGGVIGTPGYMAPEQVEGGELSARTDVYALGVVMYEMVTGKLPFEGPTPLAIATKRLTTPPPSPRKQRPDLPIQWERAVLTCLEREPGRRPPRARDVMALLDEPAVTSVHFERLRRRVPLVRPLLALLLFVAAGVLALHASRGAHTLGAQLAARGVDVAVFESGSSEVMPGYGVLLRNALRTDLGFELPVVGSRIELSSPDGHAFALGYAQPRLRGREPLRVMGSFELSGVSTERRIEVTLRVVDPSTNEQLAQIVESSPTSDFEDLVIHLGDRLRAVAHLTPTPSRPLSPRGRAALAQATLALRRDDLDDALEIAERALADERGAVELRFLLGRVLSALELDVSSAVAVERARALSTDDPELRDRILAASHWRDPNRAASELEVVHATHPDDDDVAFDLVYTLASAQRTDDARRVVATIDARARTPLDHLRAALASLVIARRQDRTNEVVARYPELVERASAAGFPGLELAMLQQGCAIEAWRAAPDRAAKTCREVTSLATRLERPAPAIASSIYELGSNLSVETRPEYLDRARRMLQFSRQLGGRILSAEALCTYAIVALDLKVPGVDTSLLQAALDLARAAHDQGSVVATLFNLAYYANRDDHSALGISYLRQVIELSVDNGAPLYRYDALCRLGLAQIDIGHMSEARQQLDEALHTTNATPDADDVDCPDLAAYLDYEQQRPDDAVDRFEKIASIDETSGDHASARQQAWVACQALYDAGRFSQLIACTERYDARLLNDGAPASRSSKLTRAAALAELGRVEEARALAAKAGWPKHPPPGSPYFDALVAVALERSFGAPTASIDAEVDEIVGKMQHNDYVPLVLRARIERGRLLRRDHHSEAALAELRAVREEALHDGLTTIAGRVSEILAGR